MKAKSFVLTAVVFSLTLFAFCRQARAQGTAFTYQGNLTSGNAGANGSYDLRFGLYTNISTGNNIGSLETNSAVAVSNGLFTTTLNFSNVFNGTAYWLEIGVRSNGTTNAFTILSPRQPITPTPYAITASNLTGTVAGSNITGTVSASTISGTFSNTVNFTNLTNVIAGNGSGLYGVPSVTSSNWLYAYDTTSQLLTTAGSFQYITFSTTSYSGWFIGSSGQFTAPTPGVYLVNYQVQIANNNSTTTLLGIVRGVANQNTEITSSEGVTYVPPASIGLISRSFLINMAANETISLQWSSNIGGSYLITSSLFGQNFNSAFFTAVKIQ